MEPETIDHTEEAIIQSESPMIHIRTGIFLYLAIFEGALTLAMLLREIFITIGVEPKNNLLWTEIFTTLVILTASPFIAKLIKKKITQGIESSKRLLRTVTLFFILSILVTLINNYYLVTLLPYSYGNGVFLFENYMCDNIGSTWFSYWFMLFNSALIGAIFAKVK